MSALTAERVRELLDYNPETGVFLWKVSRGRVAAGAIAGGSMRYPGNWDAWVIRIDTVLHYAHRLAWLYVHGEWPPMQIDHRDGNPLNNRISNLRLASSSQNNQNKRVMNTTGFKGVSFARKSGKWMARIKLGGKTMYIGVYASREEAGAAYLVAAQKYFGEFARA